METLSDTAYCNDLILLSLEPYNVILNAITYTMRRTFIIAAAGAVLAICAIFAFSLYFVFQPMRGAVPRRDGKSRPW